MRSRFLGSLCLVGLFLNIFNAAILGPDPVVVLSVIFCGIGAWYHLD